MSRLAWQVMTAGGLLIGAGAALGLLHEPAWLSAGGAAMLAAILWLRGRAMQGELAKMQALLDAAQLPYLILDEHAQVKAFSSAFVERSGLAPTQLNGAYFPSILAQDCAASLESQIRRALQGSPRFATEIQLARGIEIPPLRLSLTIEALSGNLWPRQVLLLGTDRHQPDLEDPEASARTQQYIQRLIDVIPYPVHVKDANSRFLLGNDAFAKEHAQPNQEAPGSSTGEEDRRVLAGESLLNEESAPDPQTGKQRYRVVSKASCEDLHGNQVIVVASFDVTPWRLAEQELAAALQRETERGERIKEYVQRLIDVIPEPVYVKDSTGCLLTINKAFAREHGVEERNVLGTDVASLPNIMRATELIREEDAQVLAGNSIYKEECARSPVSGANVYRIITKARCLDDEGRTVIVGTHFNISLWREAEHRAMKALELQRRTHEFLQSIFDSLPNPIFVLNSQMQHVMVNQAFLNGLGLCRAEVEGFRSEEFLPLELIPVGQLAIDEDWVQNGREGDVQEKLLSLPNPQGETSWLIMRQVQCQSIDGERIILGAVNDITSLRKTEMRWFEAKEAAERANAAKSEFLANMSHELRTPMHAILSFARLGKDRVPTESSERLAGYFERIVTSGERLMRLLDALLDISKLEAGRMIVKLETVDLRQLLDEAVSEHEALLATRQLRIVRHFGEIQMVNADASLLRQVIGNLLSNAIKFSPAQGIIDLTLGSAATAVNRSDSPAMFELTVADRGLGVPEAERYLIFDKFVQSSATRSGAGGTGLGLAICKEIVSLHSGEIFVRSRTGGGAEFVVRLPAITTPSPP